MSRREGCTSTEVLGSRALRPVALRRPDANDQRREGTPEESMGRAGSFKKNTSAGSESLASAVAICKE